MQGYGIIMTIILGGIAGWVAEKLMNFNSGLILNIVLGIVGAVVGNFVLGLIGIGGGGLIMQVIIAIVGACILIYGYRLIKSNS